jgi:L-cystine transport system permease protein
MTFQLKGFLECLWSGIGGLPNTLVLTLIPIAVGLVLGSLIAIVRIFKVPVLSQVLATVVTIYQGVPVVTALLVFNLLFIMKFDDVARAFGWTISVANVPTIWIGVIVLSLSATCAMTETIRGAFISIDKFQYEAGYSVGLTTPQIMRRIIVPQVVPVAIPPLMNCLVGIIKGTSVMMTIGIMDIMNGALLPCQTTYSFLVGYVAAAVIYWILTIIIERLAGVLQRNLEKNKRVLA